jgi:predicted nucleic acid-binding protein
MSLRIKADDVVSVAGRPLFFDANVLLYLFGGAPYPQWAVNAYSGLFSQCLKLGNTLCLDVFVLSEFVNRFLRIEYESYLKARKMDRNQVNFKQFRFIDEGIQAAQDVEAVVKGRLLKQFKIVGKLFDESDIASIGLVDTDFNDALIVKTCEAHQCVLVTHDADFISANIDILSANQKLTKPAC